MLKLRSNSISEEEEVEEEEEEVQVLSPGLLQPLVEGVGVLSKLLTQLVVLLLPPLLLLQLQLPLLQQENEQCH